MDEINLSVARVIYTILILMQGPGADAQECLRELVTNWRDRTQVTAIQVQMSLLRPGFESAANRKEAVDWIFHHCGELATAPKTPQLATALMDAYWSRTEHTALLPFGVLSAASLSIAVKICETYVLSPHYVSQMPGVGVQQGDIEAVEREVLLSIDWAVSLVTAAEVVEVLESLGVEVPPREVWEPFQTFCYTSYCIKYGPLIIALSPFLALNCALAPKLCFDFASVSDSEIEALLSEAPLGADDCDSTISPDIKVIKPQ